MAQASHDTKGMMMEGQQQEPTSESTEKPGPYEEGTLKQPPGPYEEGTLHPYEEGTLHPYEEGTLKQPPDPQEDATGPQKD